MKRKTRPKYKLGPRKTKKLLTELSLKLSEANDLGMKALLLVRDVTATINGMRLYL